MQAIEKGGGKIIQKVDDLATFDQAYLVSKAFTVSRDFERTEKILHSIARGVRCVSHEWVLRSQDQGTMLDANQFLLPLIYRHNGDTITQPVGPNQVLRDKMVCVVAEDGAFRRLWSAVLKAAGAVVVDRPALSFATVDFVLAEDHPPMDILRQAEDQKIWLTGVDWLCEVLFTRELIPYSHIVYTQASSESPTEVPKQPAATMQARDEEARHEEAEDSTEMYSPEGNSTPSTDDPKQPAANTKPEDIFVSSSHG